VIQDDVKKTFEADGSSSTDAKGGGFRARFGALLGNTRGAVVYESNLRPRDAAHLVRNYEDMRAGWF